MTEDPNASERDGSVAPAAGDEFSELLQSLTAVERAAVWLTVPLFLAASLASPSLVVWLAGRRPSVGAAEHIFDFVVVELLGSVFLMLWPLKEPLKRWLYEEEGSRFVRGVVVAVWVVGLFGVLALLLPQGFFLFTLRETASTLDAWMADTAACALALVPQVVALGPYIWAVRRAFARRGEGFR